MRAGLLGRYSMLTVRGEGARREESATSMSARRERGIGGDKASRSDGKDSGKRGGEMIQKKREQRRKMQSRGGKGCVLWKSEKDCREERDLFWKGGSRGGGKEAKCSQ